MTHDSEKLSKEIFVEYFYNNLDNVKDLLIYNRLNININKTDNHNFTLLHYVCMNDEVELLQFLLKEFKNLNINAKDENYCTPLMCACLYDNIEIVKLLICCEKFSVNEVDKKGNNAFMYSVFNENLDIARLLIKKSNFSDEWLKDTKPLLWYDHLSG